MSTGGTVAGNGGALGPSWDSERPVRLSGELEQPSRGWWLLKWLLIVPHVVILVFLWIAFFFVSVIAFFAILFTTRYPRGLFDFNLGVLRWTWRVSYYSYSALATDRYPPFSLGEQPDYPARLEIDYPEHLSRGLVLVKWWLLAIPQYIVIGIFSGSGYGGGLVLTLVIFAGISLLFRASYPRGMYDFVMGMNRWVYRVIVYAALMRDEYPPFRLDMGAREPAAPAPLPPPPAPVPPAA